MAETRAQLAAEWLLARRAFDAAKTNELEARERLVEAIFPDGAPEGTKHTLFDVYDVETVRRPSVKIKDAVVYASAVDLIGSDLPMGPELLSRLIKQKPEILVGEFRKLPIHYAELFKGSLGVELSPATVKVTRKGDA